MVRIAAHTHTHTHTHTHFSLSLSLYLSLYLSLSVYIYIYIYICMCVCANQRDKVHVCATSMIKPASMPADTDMLCSMPSLFPDFQWRRHSGYPSDPPLENTSKGVGGDFCRGQEIKKKEKCKQLSSKITTFDQHQKHIPATTCPHQWSQMWITRRDNNQNKNKQEHVWGNIRTKRMQQLSSDAILAGCRRQRSRKTSNHSGWAPVHPWIMS